MLLVGYITGAHGIKGQVSVKSLTFPLENIFKYKLHDQDSQEISISRLFKKNSGEFVCKVAGVQNRNQAELMKSKQLFCAMSELEKFLEEDEVYIENIKGFKVKAEGSIDIEIGIVSGIMNFGAGDILEILLKRNKEKILLPFNKDFVAEITSEYIIIRNCDGYLFSS